MKNFQHKNLKRLLVVLVLATVTLTADAQKQPQIQEISMRAPVNLRIDGKMNEWPSPFLGPQKTDGYLSAYNSSSRVYYTVANDDNNLYFVIRGLGSGVVNKALAGGLTVTISHLTDRKREKAVGNVMITFPIPQDIKITRVIMGTIASAGELVDEDSVANRRRIDSIGVIANRQMSEAMKEIRIVGVKEIPDSMISVYNTEGIKAAAGFVKRQPIIELAIPLKYLGLSIDNPVKFSYNIRLGAIPEINAPRPDVASVSFPPPVVLSASNASPFPVMGQNPNVGFLYNPTDFWGTYILAAK